VTATRLPESLAALHEELDSAALYDALAALGTNPRLAEVYRRIAEAERRHAGAWSERLRTEGIAVPEHRPSFRTRALVWLARRFGLGLILPSVASLEQIHGHEYAQAADATATPMAAEERSHARLLRRLAGANGGLGGSAVAQLEGRHRAAGGNALRAAVLGANDGLVSNLGIILSALTVGLVAALLDGAYRWNAGTQALRARLDAARVPIRPPVVDLRELDGLPAPVQRYFRVALKEGQPMVAGVRVRHEGTFTMGETTDHWKPFTSDQKVVTQRPGFDWDGRVAMIVQPPAHYARAPGP
jgi:hypothetical protein